MNDTDNTEIQPQPAPSAPVNNPPSPPGGGSWTWDDANAVWVSNDQPASQKADEQE